MVNSDEFAKRLEQLFVYYDLNASTFAEKIDVGRASISHLLSGRNKPSLDFVMKVVQTFPEVELYWLLIGKGSFPKKPVATPSEKPKPPAEAKEEIPIRKEPTTSQQALHVQQESDHAMKTPLEKSISKVIVCYSDGTFEAFNPS